MIKLYYYIFTFDQFIHIHHLNGFFEEERSTEEHSFTSSWKKILEDRSMSISLLCSRGQHSRKTPEAPISPVTNSRSRPFLHKHMCNLVKHGPYARKARHLRFESPLLVGHLSSWSPHLFLSSGTSFGLATYI